MDAHEADELVDLLRGADADLERRVIRTFRADARAIEEDERIAVLAMKLDAVATL